MSKADKLLSRFLSRPKDFTFEELVKLLGSLGYDEAKPGKTSGSRVAFFDARLDHMIKFHRPHPKQIMRQCYLREIEQSLRDREVIP